MDVTALKMRYKYCSFFAVTINLYDFGHGVWE